MKKTILLTVILLVAGFTTVSAQKTVNKGTTTTSSESTPLKPFYDAKLKVQTHVKAGTAVLHGALDYVKFNANGTYEQSFTGTVKTGTWKYNLANNTVTITIGANSITYSLNVTGTTRVGLTTSTEELLLVTQS